MSRTALDDTPDVPLALYNRYRPRRMSELVGQDHVAVPLRRAIESGRIHHAYLFSGPRGCGKTSTARIVAAGLVCEHGPTTEPCGQCTSCLSVIATNHLDVIEIDAATNGRVDDARELRDKAHYAPVHARFKVIIVDEAHMVTKEGFNALLKLIEEPPPHVRFIFATTDVNKVLPTIRSRTYNYPFHLVPAPVLAPYLMEVVAKENATLDDGVLPMVLRAGGGSVRDSLAVLGQLLDGSDGGHVRLDETAALLGATADHVLDGLVGALANRDTAAALTAVGAAIDAGADPRRMMEDLLDRCRDLLLLATTGMLPPFAEVAGPARQEEWKAAAAKLGVAGLTAACEHLQGAVGGMNTGQPRITLEVTVARILLSTRETSDVSGVLASLQDQVSALTKMITADGAVTSGPRSPAAPAAPATPQTDTRQVPPQRAEPAMTPSVTAPATDVDQVWQRVLAVVMTRRRASGALMSSMVTVGDISDQRVLLKVPNDGLAKTIRDSGHADVVADAASEVLGGTWAVEVRVVT